MSEAITSPLLKSVLLAYNSDYFPLYVRAAARRQGIVYDELLLNDVATDPSVVDAITIPDEGSVDGWLNNQGSALDQLFLDAVVAHGTAE